MNKVRKYIGKSQTIKYTSLKNGGGARINLKGVQNHKTERNK